MPTTKKSSPKVKAPTPVSEWKKASATAIIDLPSGFSCRVKRPGLPKLLADNILPDTLTPLAQKAIAMGEGGNVDPKEADKLIQESLSEVGSLEALMDMCFRITAECVIEPHVTYSRRKVRHKGSVVVDEETGKDQWENIPDEERDEHALYTDEVDIDDQMFIMQYVVGGSQDLEQFRREFGQSMASVQSI